jgi:hypothetical protein
MHFVPPEVAEFSPLRWCWGEWGNIHWLPRGHQSLDHSEKPSTCVEAERCLRGPVLRACGRIGVVKGSAQVCFFEVVESFVMIGGEPKGFPD